MNILAVFNYKQSQVRTVTIDSEPWFAAQDVCNVLEIKNTSDALGRLDDDEKGVVLTDTLGGKQDLLYVSECDRFSLIICFMFRIKNAKLEKSPQL
jgi:anti-repressor protein